MCLLILNHLLGQNDSKIRLKFLNILKEELSENPPNYNQYISLINKIKMKMIDAVDKNLIKTTNQIIEKNLQIKKDINKLYVNNDIYNTCIFCLNILKEFDEFDKYELVEFYINKLNIMINNSEKYDIYIIINVFKIILDKLDN